MYDKDMKPFDNTSLLGLSHPTALSHVAETHSTNDDLKVAARNGAPDYTLRVADRQSFGRGRGEHSFYSEGGLYMSILLPFQEERFSFVTPIAAIAVARAISELTGESAKIKWVNDVYVRGKKVCGILSESIVAQGKRRVICGIGINLNTAPDAFPEEIREIAGSISADRSELAARILKHLYLLLDITDLDTIREEYRALSFLIDREITVYKEKGCLSATVLGLTEDLSLSVRYKDGTRENLIAGEVGIRLFEKETH